MSFALNCWGDNIQKQGNVTLHEIGRTGRVESESREKSGPPRQIVPTWHDTYNDRNHYRSHASTPERI